MRYKKIMSKDSGFERRFQTVQVEESSSPDTVTILHGIRDSFEKHHDVKISDAALEAAAKLSDRYVQGRALPDKAIDCLDEACATLRMMVRKFLYRYWRVMSLQQFFPKAIVSIGIVKLR